MGNCFLIADEVGLGKTRSARTILYEIARQKGRVHAIYIASNLDLARQNMQNEFLNGTMDDSQEKAGVVRSKEESYEGLAQFQQDNAKAVLNEFGYDPDVESTKGLQNNTIYIRPFSQDKYFRLSMFFHEIEQKKQPDWKNQSYIMQLSPTTSFFSPEGQSLLTDGYHGSKSEREELARLLHELGNSGDSSSVHNYIDYIQRAYKAACRFFVGINRRPISEISKISEAITSGSITADDLNNTDVFSVARWIISQAAAECYQPDLIILDEFQRYRNSLSNSGNKSAYTIQSMVSYLSGECAPKVLLLSATPYIYNRQLMDPVPWVYQDEQKDSIDIDTRNSEKPYEDFNTLRGVIGALGGNIREGREHFMVRTQLPHRGISASGKSDAPSSLSSEDQRSLPALKDLSSRYQFRYLNPIYRFLAAYLADHRKDSDQIRNDIRNDIRIISSKVFDTPGFWQFTYGYQKEGKITENTRKKLYESEKPCPGEQTGHTPEANGTYDVYANLPLQELIREVIPQGESLPALWVPPVRQNRIGTGKTLVFTSRQMTTRSVTYYVDQYVRQHLENLCCCSGAPLEPLPAAEEQPPQKNHTERDTSPLENQLKKFFGQILARVFKAKDQMNTSDESHDNLIRALIAFFQRPFVHSVITAYNRMQPRPNASYAEAVQQYCSDYDFEGMLEEYIWVLSQQDDAASAIKKRIEEVFAFEPTSLVMFNAEDQKVFYTPSYAQMFVEDDNKSGDRTFSKEQHSTEKASGNENSSDHNSRINNSNTLEDICNQFNSPLYPMVLVARNTAQEGFNLQYYGDKLMHWQPAASVSAFLQREGRLDRPNSLIYRHKVWQWNKVCAEKKPPAWFHKPVCFSEASKNLPGIFKEDTYEQYKEKAEKEAGASGKGLFPLWLFPAPPECKDISVRQILPYSVFNEDVFDRLIQMLAAARNYGGIL